MSCLKSLQSLTKKMFVLYKKKSDTSALDIELADIKEKEMVTHANTNVVDQSDEEWIIILTYKSSSIV